jgi:DEAD/DEAH box helicase domain-containing protein
VRQTKADYYTQAIDYTRLKVLETFAEEQAQSAATAHGEVHLVRRVAGYKKIRYYSHENIGYGNVNLPDQEMHTTALWWYLRPDVLDRQFASRGQALDGFLGAAHAMHFVAALLSMCEPGDLGRAVGASDATWFTTVGVAGRGETRNGAGEALDPEAAGALFQPAVFLYDNYPGGIGLSAPLYDLRARLIREARRTVEDCSCAAGCPACIGPILGSEERCALTGKDLALVVLSLLADEIDGSS